MADASIVIEAVYDDSALKKGMEDSEKDWDKYNKALETRCQDFSQISKDIFTESFVGISEGFVAIGEALANGEDGARSFGRVMLEMVGNVLKAFSEQLMAMAAIEFVKKEYASGAKALAGAAAAGIASGIIKGLAGKFENGGIVGGTSYSGDRLLAQVNSGELILNQAQQGVIANKLQQSAIGDFKVVINNNANVDVRQEQHLDRGMLDIFIENKVLQTMSSRRGANIMQSSYGINKLGVQRG